MEQAFKEHFRVQLVLQGITNNGSTQHGYVDFDFDLLFFLAVWV